jgi:zinc protease
MNNNPLAPFREPEAVGFPSVARSEVAAGLKILAVPRRDTPFVSLHLVLRGGSEHDPSGKAGLAALTADMLEAGSGSKRYQDIARQVDALGATMVTGTTVDGSMISVSFLSESLPGVLILLGEMLTGPTFPADEFERR